MKYLGFRPLKIKLKYEKGKLKGCLPRIKEFFEYLMIRKPKKYKD